jgi:hypothetical protein
MDAAAVRAMLSGISSTEEQMHRQTSVRSVSGRDTGRDGGRDGSRDGGRDRTVSVGVDGGGGGDGDDNNYINTPKSSPRKRSYSLAHITLPLPQKQSFSAIATDWHEGLAARKAALSSLHSPRSKKNSSNSSNNDNIRSNNNDSKNISGGGGGGGHSEAETVAAGATAAATATVVAAHTYTLASPSSPSSSLSSSLSLPPHVHASARHAAPQASRHPPPPPSRFIASPTSVSPHNTRIHTAAAFHIHSKTREPLPSPSLSSKVVVRDPKTGNAALASAAPRTDVSATATAAAAAIATLLPQLTSFAALLNNNNTNGGGGRGGGGGDGGAAFVRNDVENALTLLSDAFSHCGNDALRGSLLSRAGKGAVSLSRRASIHGDSAATAALAAKLTSPLVSRRGSIVDIIDSYKAATSASATSSSSTSSPSPSRPSSPRDRRILRRRSSVVIDIAALHGSQASASRSSDVVAHIGT